MKVTVFFLALSALIAASNSAPAAEKDQYKKVIFTDGVKGPDDTLLGIITTKGNPNFPLNFQETSWRLSEAKAHVAYVAILEVGSTANATVTITSGGVGSDHLTFKAVPNNNGGYHFKVEIWGTVIKN